MRENFEIEKAMGSHTIRNRVWWSSTMKTENKKKQLKNTPS